MTYSIKKFSILFVLWLFLTSLVRTPTITTLAPVRIILNVLKNKTSGWFFYFDYSRIDYSFAQVWLFISNSCDATFGLNGRKAQIVYFFRSSTYNLMLYNTRLNSAKTNKGSNQYDTICTRLFVLCWIIIFWYFCFSVWTDISF